MFTHEWRGGQGCGGRCKGFARRLAGAGGGGYGVDTASPRNLPSVRALESAGLQTVLIKEKYGGKLRCIMLKRLSSC